MDKPNNLCLTYLPTESHIYLITSQKHSMNFHLPLPQKYGGGAETHFEDAPGETLFAATRASWTSKGRRGLRSVCSPDRWNVARASAVPAPRVGHLLPATEVERATTLGPTQTCQHSTMQKTLCYLSVRFPWKSWQALPFPSCVFCSQLQRTPNQPTTQRGSFFQPNSLSITRLLPFSSH